MSTPGAHAEDDGAYAPAIGSLASEVAGLVERVDELALQVLQEAVDAGATSRPALERRLTRARHALERALDLLGGGRS